VVNRDFAGLAAVFVKMQHPLNVGGRRLIPLSRQHFGHRLRVVHVPAFGQMFRLTYRETRVVEDYFGSAGLLH
jgi:hypothetical protein